MLGNKGGDQKDNLPVVIKDSNGSNTGLDSVQKGARNQVSNILITENLLFSSSKEFYELQFTKLIEIANLDDFKSFVTGFYRKAGANDELIGIIFEKFVNITEQVFPDSFINTMREIVSNGTMQTADKIFDSRNLKQMISTIQRGGNIDKDKVFFLGLGKSVIIAYYYHLLAKVFLGNN